MEKITLTLTVDQLNVVMSALGKAPYEVVADLVRLIRDQAIPQVNKPESE
jgi:hypothetical protein